MTSTQWANIGEDAGALHALLGRIPEHAPVATIDYLWIFPPRKIAVGESIVVVVATFDEDPARRRVSTAHFTIARDRKGTPTVTVRYSEHGSAPSSAVPRIVEGVLRRLGEDTDAAPREEQIEGAAERWAELIVELGGRPPAPPQPDGLPPESQQQGEFTADAAAADSSEAPAQAE